MSQYLSEAFKSLDSLNEDVFSIDENGLKDLAKFEEEDELTNTIDIIDADAETYDDLEDSYEGKIILDCCVCHSKQYKNIEDIVIEDDLANVGEECPFCYTNDGFKVIGQVAPFKAEPNEDDDESGTQTNEGLFGKKNKQLYDVWCQDGDEKWTSLEGVTEKEADQEIKDAIANNEGAPNFKAWKEPSKTKNEGLFGLGKKKKQKSTQSTSSPKAQQWELFDIIRDMTTGQRFDSKYEAEKEAAAREKATGHVYKVQLVECANRVDESSDDDYVYIQGAGYGTYRPRTREGLAESGDDDYIYIQGAGYGTYRPRTREGLEEPVDEAVAMHQRTGTIAKVLNDNMGELMGINNRMELINRAIEIVRGSDVDEAQKERFTRIMRTSKNPMSAMAAFITGQRKEEGLLTPPMSPIVTLNASLEDNTKKKEEGLLSPPMPPVITLNASLEDDPNDEDLEEFLDATINVDAKGFGGKDNNVSVLGGGKSPLGESVNNVNVETDEDIINVATDDAGKVTVTTEPKTTVTSGDEVIAPITPEAQNEISSNVAEGDEIEIDVDEFDEDSFDGLGESYLKKIYENVDSYKTSQVALSGDTLKVEGLIKFKSGNTKKTSFIFEARTATKTGKVKFIGENTQITKGKKAFTITGNITNKKFLSESLTYNYGAKTSDGKTKRLYGTIRK